MVYIFQSSGSRIVVTFPFSKAWKEYSFIVFSFYKNMNSFAIAIDSTSNYFSMFIFFYCRLHIRFCTTFGGFFKSTTSVFYPKSNNFNSITVLYNMVRSEEHTSELQSRPHLVCRLLLEKTK